MAVGRSQMQHQFSQVPRVNVPRSRFDRSHGLKTTFNEGDLVPVYVDEVYPGDTFNMNMTAFARLATPLHPFMDNMFLDVFFFFVPNRLVWDNFKKFMGEQDNPGDSTSYLVPQQVSTAVTGYGELSLQDYMGLPTKVPGMTHSALPLRCYNLIWNQWFRDQNLQNSVVVDRGDGPDTVSNYAMLKRGKRHDYFTASLPWPQKGPAVSIPLGTTAPVVTGAQSVFGAHLGMTWMDAATGAAPGANASLYSAGGTGITQAVAVGATGGSAYIPNNLSADLTTATAATINAIRQAVTIQQIYEKDARGGTRYTELIQAHFGVTSPDARLQRSEYLGGGSVPFNVNPIAQTAGTGTTGSTTPQGNLAAVGTTTPRAGFSKSFTEHGTLIGLVSLRADLNYQQGLNRMWSRNTRFDYFWPNLVSIGEQAVLNKEIYCVGSANPTQDAAAFGYQERYGELRYKPNQITGRFRSNCTQPLDTWHLAQNFASLPALNSTFIVENPPVSRIVAVPTEPRILFDAFFNLICARPMPIYSVPGITRF